MRMFISLLYFMIAFLYVIIGILHLGESHEESPNPINDHHELASVTDGIGATSSKRFADSETEDRRE